MALFLVIHTIISVSLAMTFNIANPVKLPIGAEKFMDLTREMNYVEREKLLLEQLLLGNVPDDIRQARSFKFDQKLIDGKSYHVEIWISHDYLTFGTNEDWVRIPVSFATANKLAKTWDAYPPTTKLVRMIYRHAKIKLFALSQNPDDRTMRSNEVIMLNNNRIEHARRSIQSPTVGEYWIAGHKKDYVISKRLLEKKKREAIYGWFDKNGKIIQPLSIIHSEDYADYSHGLRLVHANVMINGVRFHYRDVLQHPILSALLNEEGPLPMLPIFENREKLNE